MTYHPLPNGARQRKRNGKIARLPEATRERINQMLRDGVRYRAIICALGQLTEPPLPYTLSEMNLSNWYRGGYQEWCHRQQQLQLARKFPLPQTPSQQPVSTNPTFPWQIQAIRG